MIKAWKRRMSLLLALVVALTVIVGFPTYVSAGEATVINIFSVNDFHGSVDKSASASNPGADRFVAIVQELMSQNENSVLLAAGDTYQGSPLSNVFNGEPVSEMLKLLGVEYAALGNHEYDWGEEYIYDFIEDGDVTFLSANIFLKGTESRPDYVEPYAVIEIGGKKIGLVGLITTDVPQLVKAEIVEHLEFRAPGAWLTPIIDSLKNEYDCEIVIGLTHMTAYATDGKITSGDLFDIANADYGFDALIGGHHHTHAADTVNGVPIVVGGFNGRGLGHLKIECDGDDITITPAFFSQNDMNTDAILPATEVKNDEGRTLRWDPDVVNAEMTAIIADFQERIGPMFATVVGTFGEAITSRHEQAVWATQVVWDYIYRATGDEYILFQNGGGWRDTSPYDRIASTEVTLGYLYTVMPFDNEIVLMEMRGKDILNILNRAPNADGVPLGSADTNDNLGSAAYVAGAYQEADKWYLASGAEITETGVYKVSCNDFMLTGGDAFPFPSFPGFANRVGAELGVDVIGNVSFMGVPLRNAMIDELEFRGANVVVDPPETPVAAPPETPVVAPPETPVVAPPETPAPVVAPPETPAPPAAGTGTVENCYFLNLRKGAGIDHAAFGYLIVGDVVKILDESDGWYQVETEKGVGWVYGTYLNVAGN